MVPTFAGESELHALVRAYAWETSPLGPVASWSASLIATVRTVLASRYPMVLTWGPALTQIYNDGYARLIGDKHPSALGQDIRITLAEGWDTLGPMIDDVMRAHKANWITSLPLLLQRSGYREESYFDVSHAPAEDDDGSAAGMLAVCSEVTTRVLGERRTRLLRDLSLQASETRAVDEACRNLIHVLAEQPLDLPFALLYVRDADGRLTLQGATGLEPGGSGAPRVLAVADDAHDPWSLARAMQGEVVELAGIDAHVTLRGGFFHDPVTSALALPLTGSSGAPLGVLVAGISPNRALDEGYRSFYDLLAAQLASTLRNARTHEEERRRIALLAELDRAKTAFFSNASHELRTPLTLILGPMQQLLAEGGLEEPARRELDVVHRNAQRLSRLVNTLLDFSRLEASRIEASREPVDLAALTSDIASSFRASLERAGLSLRVDCPPLAQPAYVDPELWEKIVLNLLSNAFKFTLEGGIEVTLEEHGEGLVLQVADSGIGIPKAELGRVFERFHRVPGALGRTHEGSGIGLSLVRDLARLHGGDVRVDSELGVGTTFTVTLPRGDVPALAPGQTLPRTMASVLERRAAFVEETRQWGDLPARAGESAEHEAGSEGRGTTKLGRVLVVDDNADMRSYLARVLAPCFEVVSARDGQAALARLREDPAFDLLLTDIMMPRLGGFGLLKHVRDDPRTRALPVIMLSARAGEEASVEGLEAGADDYLVKPFSPRELVARVRTTLELSRMRAALASHEASEQSLRESMRARDEFLTIASHELRTPLTALQLQVALLAHQGPGLARDDVSAQVLSKRLARIRGQGERLQRLMDELLDVARLVGGFLPLTLAPVELGEVAHEVTQRLAQRGAFESGRCELRLQIDRPAVGRWDRLRVAQILGNLLENALKYGAGKPIDVRVTSDAASATLRVRDYGIGIAPEEQRRIFDRFERAVSVRQYGGFGLGLYIARELCELLGGSIAVESEPGLGALFTVTLPLEGPAEPRASGPSRDADDRDADESEPTLH